MAQSTQKRGTVSAVIVAAGRSSRMGFDKLACRLPDGRTVLQASVQAFDTHPDVDELVLVAGEQEAPCRELAARCRKPCTVVRGGRTRAQSALAGVQAAQGALVAIHDAARPFVSADVIGAALQAAAASGAAAPAVPVKDTIKQADDARRICGTPDRSTLFAVQTPQCFDRVLYLRARQALAPQQADESTDDCRVMELAGLPVILTKGDYANRKITTPEDLPAGPTSRGGEPVRIGHGYDVHRLVEQRKLILGGVEIPFDLGLLGHSDADVLLHAVMDALLGAAALGDIGQHFPDNDPAYAGADSLALLRRVNALVRGAGYAPANIDATILCQRPKLASYIPSMRANIAAALDLTPGQVSVKATTEEGLGFTGSGQGIAAHAVALLQ